MYMLEAEYIHASKHFHEFDLQEESKFTAGGILAFVSTHQEYLSSLTLVGATVEGMLLLINSKSICDIESGMFLILQFNFVCAC
jgi:hypothetical protein